MRCGTGEWIPCQLLEKKFFRFHLCYSTLPFLSPQSTHTFAPREAASTTITTVSTAGDFNDNDIRVLPIREQIMASSLIAMITSDDGTIEVAHDHHNSIAAAVSSSPYLLQLHPSI